MGVVKALNSDGESVDACAAKVSKGCLLHGAWIRFQGDFNVVFKADKPLCGGEYFANAGGGEKARCAAAKKD